MRRVSPREAHELIEREGYVYLDVRSPPEFDEGHPSGAYNIPLALPAEAGMAQNPSFLREVESTFTRESKIVVGCASGIRSLEAAKLLAHEGFAHVIEQCAGMSGQRDSFGRLSVRGWRDEGLPVSNEPQPARSHREIVARASS